MPTLSTFFGISIRMYYDDHAPSHFHAYYGEHEAKVSIETLEIIAGKLPRRALAMVLEWAMLHREELRVDWERAASHEPMLPIQPLE